MKSILDLIPFGLASIACLITFSSLSFASTVSPLFNLGYTVLPTPQKINLGDKDFEFTKQWRVEFGAGVKPDSTEAQEFTALLSERFHVGLATSGSSGGVVRLAIQPGIVSPTETADKDVSELARQAYRLTLASDQIDVTGNSATGLFYGIGTLVQLLKTRDGKLWLPEAVIEDWPNLQLRVIYWDDAHHLEHLNVLKAALRQASFFKINGFAIKLEGHFEYRHAKPIVEPYALTPAELQELTNYGLKYHVQLIPFLDGPAHDAFILKHPEYAALREYPDSNYEFCATNPQTYRLLEDMMDDLLAANKGGKYFVLSTDEPYYVGLAQNAQCEEAERAKQLGSVGKVLAEFVTKAAGYLHDRGRTVIFWGEYPMKPDDIGALPKYVVNGELYGPRYDPVFRAHGIRQMIYTSTEGEEQLFPQYYPVPAAARLHAVENGPGRVEDMLDTIKFASSGSLSSVNPDSPQPNQADLMGAFIAGWGDPGQHPETFWLGYVTGPAAAWNQNTSNYHECQSSFYSLFYGADATDMGRVYQLMSEGAQRWEDTWETGASAARKPIWGNSFGVLHPPQPARDQYLPRLPVPSAELLHVDTDWTAANEKRLAYAGQALAANDELLDLLYTNIGKVELNRYNLQIYLSIAYLYRQNLLLIEDLARVSDALKQAEATANRAEPSKALELVDRALDIAEAVRESRNRALKDATSTWCESWFPRVAHANGRTYRDELDDVKDHQPGRTGDMSYLVYRELLYPMGDWARLTVAARNTYASAHGLPARNWSFNWQDTGLTEP